ncbi:a-factor receptor [Vermiconidia calcicola]|uniref:A-factor receptor n=1 Tax=Vermiconidia calcicola TaxID=1690605 RepID=A0ACC3MSW8_9PEZI|nr:a-factor receptor [Vermiconidia calcicola]
MDSTGQVFLAAILLALFSFIFLLLILPPMFWHFRNRNIGATILVAWVVTLLLFTFVNALLWPSDDISNWYNGGGLCDFEVKIQVASQVAFPASLACILRALAAVLDTDRATLIQSKAQRRRNYFIDLTWCIGFPLLQMFLHYIVQTHRYYVYGISGCVPAVSLSWVTILLMVVPPATWTLVDAYYAVLILVRLYRYRISFNAILAISNTTKSRFLRLYVICILWILGAIPVEIYTVYFNIETLAKEPYSWSSTHDPEAWKQIIMIPSGGQVVYDRWIWLTCGVVVFVFFGLGREALAMYRTGLLAVGFGKIFPTLRPDHRGSTTATISSYSSKAKMLFKSRTSTSTWTSSTNNSYTMSSSALASPKKTAFLGSIDETSGVDEKHGDNRNQQTRCSLTTGKAASSKNRPSVIARVLSLFQAKKQLPVYSSDPLPLAVLTGQPTTVHATVLSGPRSPTLAQHVRGISADEVVVRKEVRQGSDHGEGAPAIV